MNLSLGKIWQADDGRLLFQASFFDGQTRQKGFLMISPSLDHPIQWLTEKSEHSLHGDGAAAILRKYCGSSSVKDLYFGKTTSGCDFVRLKLQVTGTVIAPHSTIYLSVVGEKPPYLDIASDSLSLARVTHSKTFTVHKPADPELLLGEALDEEGLHFWIKNLCSAPTKSLVTSSVPSASLPLWRRQVRDRLARRLKTLEKTLKQDEKHLPTNASIENLERKGNILKEFIWKIKKGDEKITLSFPEVNADKEINEEIIPLNPELSPGENLSAYFKKLERMKEALKLQVPRQNQIQKQIEQIRQSLQTLRDHTIPLSESQGREILIRFGMERSTHTSSPVVRSSSQKIGRLFACKDGSMITLGRSAQESDEVVKKARSNDWWLHISGGGHGSHVIIRPKVAHGELSDSAFRDGAILALHFSDRKASQEGEVYLGRRHQIRKKKGMPPGLWLIERVQTRLIRYSSGELEEVFSRELRDGIQRMNT